VVLVDLPCDTLPLVAAHRPENRQIRQTIHVSGKIICPNRFSHEVNFGKPGRNAADGHS
jgi:hypothetical protein